MKTSKYLLILVVIVFFSGCLADIAMPSDKRIAREHGMPVVFTHIGATRSNSAGGVGSVVYLTNVSKNTVKYYSIKVKPYNRVGDVVSSEIGNKTIAALRDTGPFSPEQSAGGVWENTWYNNSINCIEVDSIKITYMDNSIIALTKNELEHALGNNMKNNCSTNISY